MYTITHKDVIAADKEHELMWELMLAEMESCLGAEH